MVSAIIVAAGKGTRMGAKGDKLFLELGGCPIVAHTWRRFDEAECIDEIVMVVREGMQAAFAELAEKHRFRKKFRARRRRQRAAGLRLEWIGGAVPGHRDCGDSGRRAALHEPRL